jgi:Sigma-70 region 2
MMMRLVAAPAGAHAHGAENQDVRALYRRHRADLLRLATLLVGDEAEEVVHDAFVRTYLAWDRLRDPERALSYLRSAPPSSRCERRQPAGHAKVQTFLSHPFGMLGS